MTRMTKKVIEAVRRLRIAKPQELAKVGLSATGLARLVAAGQIARIGRGLYSLPNADLGEKYSILVVAARVPGCVICLLSALRVHELTTQNPSEVWIRIPFKARPPSLEYPPLRVIRATQPVFDAGVERKTINGIQVKVYGPAKTVADCFKFRSIIGQDVAVEALRDCWQQRKATMEELWTYAKLNRVTKIMQPYLESLM